MGCQAQLLAALLACLAYGALGAPTRRALLQRQQQVRRAGQGVGAGRAWGGARRGRPHMAAHGPRMRCAKHALPRLAAGTAHEQLGQPMTAWRRLTAPSHQKSHRRRMRCRPLLPCLTRSRTSHSQVSAPKPHAAAA